MNLKKGLTRLFVLGLAISVIVGFVMVDEKVISRQQNFYDDSASEIEKEMTHWECQSMLKLTLESSLPEFRGYRGACQNTLLFWSGIKKRQLETKTQEIDVKFVQNYIRSEGAYHFYGNWLMSIFVYLIGYVLVCLLSWLIFITLRWVKRGFSS